MKGGRVVFNEASKRWVWRCSACGKEGFWDDNWLWYGSWRDVDNDTIKWVACSAECMRQRK
jgi:hypothetical protein